MRECKHHIDCSHRKSIHILQNTIDTDHSHPLQCCHRYFFPFEPATDAGVCIMLTTTAKLLIISTRTAHSANVSASHYTLTSLDLWSNEAVRWTTRHFSFFHKKIYFRFYNERSDAATASYRSRWVVRDYTDVSIYMYT